MIFKLSLAEDVQRLKIINPLCSFKAKASSKNSVWQKALGIPATSNKSIMKTLHGLACFK